jgi:hypothetical protein
MQSPPSPAVAVDSPIPMISTFGFDSFAPALSAFRPARLCRGFPARAIPIYVAPLPAGFILGSC